MRLPSASPSNGICRNSLEGKVLALFADLASVATSKTQLYDLGSLLPVLAACYCGDESVSLHSNAQIVKVGVRPKQIAVHPCKAKAAMPRLRKCDADFQ